MKAMDPSVRAKKSYSAPGKNLYTNPGKHGTGFGYVGSHYLLMTCINLSCNTTWEHLTYVHNN